MLLNPIAWNVGKVIITSPSNGAKTLPSDGLIPTPGPIFSAANIGSGISPAVITSPLTG